MQYKKPLLLFYIVMLAALGVIIAAESPQPCPSIPTGSMKSCKVPDTQKSPVPQKTIAEGLTRYKA